MRCFINASSARDISNTFNMIAIGNLALGCLLAIAGLSGHADGSTPKEQRRGWTDPYIISPPGSRPDSNEAPPPKDLGKLDFTLRHIYHHGTHQHPNIHRYIDIPKNAQLEVTGNDGATKGTPAKSLSARVMSTDIQRMADRRSSTIDRLLDYAGLHGEAVSLPASAWTVDEIPGPNHTDKLTVLTFAKMAGNAYVTEPWTGEWQDVRGGFNYTEDFGWEKDGLRGHIFADETNGTVVIGLKGTSMAVFDGAETTGNDKLNDNLFGSCCCGQGGHFTWKQVCDCMTSAYTCNSTCLVKSLREKSHYYWAAKDLYQNVTERYPKSDVWMSGHSLGGVVGTLLGLTFGFPVMTFEAFPDALAAQRLGLPVPPGYRIGAHQSRPEVAIHHYGHTADPVFMGSCNAASSLCSIAGYAFEGYCHTGSKCIYDTVGDLGWRVGVGTHRITSVIKDVLEKYDDVPVCVEDTECVDCYNWKFFESNGTEITTTSSATSTSSSTRTRTETCKTPGWWGCLDETTTTSGSISTTSSSSSSTSTCETPGWFGCKDITTITSSSVTSTSSAAPAPTITTTSSYATSSNTCETPGWFGCNDPTTTTSSTAKPSPSASQTTPSATGSSISTSTPSSSNLPTTRRKCISRHWYGTCKEWSEGFLGFESDLRI